MIDRLSKLLLSVLVAVADRKTQQAFNNEVKIMYYSAVVIATACGQHDRCQATVVIDWDKDGLDNKNIFYHVYSHSVVCF